MKNKHFFLKNPSFRSDSADSESMVNLPIPFPILILRTLHNGLLACFYFDLEVLLC
jgi:hypothetical protein